MPDGAVYAVSPICTHMGCKVHWNPAEAKLGLPLPRLAFFTYMAPSSMAPPKSRSKRWRRSKQCSPSAVCHVLVLVQSARGVRTHGGGPNSPQRGPTGLRRHHATWRNARRYLLGVGLGRVIGYAVLGGGCYVYGLRAARM